jgi:hypothetical protein
LTARSNIKFSLYRLHGALFRPAEKKTYAATFWHGKNRAAHPNGQQRKIAIFEGYNSPSDEHNFTL